MGCADGGGAKATSAHSRDRGPLVTVLITCRNRRNSTLRCLRALEEQEFEGRLAAVVVDASSEDGTAEAVGAEHPWVQVVAATADHYWNSGMRLAWGHAEKGDPDHYLWLNDDVTLDDGVIARLLAVEEALGGNGRRSGVVVGATRDPDSGAVTYGGVRRPWRARPLDFTLLGESDEVQEAESMNGNCVLVPRRVVHAVGQLDPTFVHRMGDFDYGLRVRQAGFPIWVAPGTVGTCATNPRVERSVTQEWQRLRGPKGLPPREWRVFCQRWAGPSWPLFFVSPYVRRTLARLSRTMARPRRGG